MPEASRDELDLRILVRAPTARDAAVTEQILRSQGMAVHVCESLDALIRECEAGVGAALLTEEAIVHDRRGALKRLLAEQPPWSDLPMIVLTPGGLGPRTAFPALESIGAMTFLPRPVQIASLLSTLKAALRDRRRQYALRDHLIERERTAEQLRQADRRKDEFLAMLAHELRNPLAPIRTGLDVLALNQDSPDAPLVQVMQNQVTHLVRLVDDLLDVARIMQGKIELRRESIELGSIVDRTVTALQASFSDRDQTLEVKLKGDDLTLHVDPVRLSQVLENLLNNASKYTDAGGSITLSAERQDGDVLIRVRDNGIGIEPELLPRLFDLFSQSQRAKERSKGGLGIGLALVYRLVEMHGGTISAHSDGLGMGSEFVVRLPAAEPVVAKDDAPPTAAPEVHRRVLIVDDNVPAAQMLATLLRRSSAHEVRTAHAGTEALEAAGEFQPDLVLLDLGMPGMDGYEVARRLRAEPRHREIVIAALTGFGQADDRRRSTDAGFDAHLVKPLDLGDLKALLNHPRLQPEAS